MKLTTDAVLLADFAAAEGCRTGADLGCASGVLMLLLLQKNPELFLYGLECEEEAAATAAENLRQNGWETRGSILTGDLRERSRELRAGGLDLVVANPPYYTVGSGKSAADPGRAAARGETACSLEELCACAARLLKNGGRFFLCYRPERIAELLECVRRFRLEPKRLRFVHHDRMHGASLLLLECRRSGRPGLKCERPLLLFEENGRETEEYRRIYHIE